MKNFKLFFSYRTSDKERILDLKNNLQEILPNFPFEDISENVPFSDDWKNEASQLINNCDGFICLIGKDTYESEPINWEILEASRLEKPIYICNLSEQYSSPKACGELKIKPVPWEPYKVAVEIAEILLPKALFSKHDWSKGEPDPKIIQDQYNLMVQSWEALIQRRQTVNTIYLSANSALLAGIGVLVSSMKYLGNYWSLFGIIILSGLGFLLSINWRRTITSYGTLSKAKSKVVSAFETYLPACLFDAEWRILEANRYKSTTSTDNKSASLFNFLFLLIIITSLIIIIFEYLLV